VPGWNYIAAAIFFIADMTDIVDGLLRANGTS
jgi:phosphatidylglycerophosphate synthase